MCLKIIVSLLCKLPKKKSCAGYSIAIAYNVSNIVACGEKTPWLWFAEEAMTGRTRSIPPYLNKKCMCRTHERTPDIPLTRFSGTIVVERCGATCASVARPQKGSQRWYSKKSGSMSSRLAQRRPSGGCSAVRAPTISW